jgi:hypothetical protein
LIGLVSVVAFNGAIVVASVAIEVTFHAPLLGIAWRYEQDQGYGNASDSHSTSKTFLRSVLSHITRSPASGKPIAAKVSAFFLASQLASFMQTDGSEIGVGILISAQPARAMRITSHLIPSSIAPPAREQ